MIRNKQRRPICSALKILRHWKKSFGLRRQIYKTFLRSYSPHTVFRRSRGSPLPQNQVVYLFDHDEKVDLHRVHCSRNTYGTIIHYYSEIGQSLPQLTHANAAKVDVFSTIDLFELDGLVGVCVACVSLYTDSEIQCVVYNFDR